MTAEFRPSSKKSEMIEVRVSHETKCDFLAACRREGRTASDVIRAALDLYIAGSPPAQCPPAAASPAKTVLTFLRRRRYLAMIAAAAGISALAALPSAAQPHADASCTRFQQLDANHDGQLTYGEFGGR